MSRQRSRLRIAWVLIAAIAMGVVTTVLVAAGLAAWSSPPKSYVGGSLAVRPVAPVNAEDGFVAVWTTRHPGWMVAETIGIPRSKLRSAWGDTFDEQCRAAEETRLPVGTWPILRGEIDHLEASPARYVVANGWPFLSLWCEYIYIDSVAVERGGIMVSGSEVQSWWGKVWPRAIPCRPIWLGFTLNTLIYACAWSCLLALFALSSRLRRRLRIRHGVCPMCRYDLRGATEGGCPECGWGRPTVPAAADVSAPDVR